MSRLIRFLVIVALAALPLLAVASPSTRPPGSRPAPQAASRPAPLAASRPAPQATWDWERRFARIFLKDLLSKQPRKQIANAAVVFAIRECTKSLNSLSFFATMKAKNPGVAGALFGVCLHSSLAYQQEGLK